MVATQFPTDQLAYTGYSSDYNFSRFSYERFYPGITQAGVLAKWRQDQTNLINQMKTLRELQLPRPVAPPDQRQPLLVDHHLHRQPRLPERSARSTGTRASPWPQSWKCPSGVHGRSRRSSRTGSPTTSSSGSSRPENYYNNEDPGMQIVAPLINDAIDGLIGDAAPIRRDARRGAVACASVRSRCSCVASAPRRAGARACTAAAAARPAARHRRAARARALHARAAPPRRRAPGRSRHARARARARRRRSRRRTISAAPRCCSRRATPASLELVRLLRAQGRRRRRARRRRPHGAQLGRRRRAARDRALSSSRTGAADRPARRGRQRTPLFHAVARRSPRGGRVPARRRRRRRTPPITSATRR